MTPPSTPTDRSPSRPLLGLALAMGAACVGAAAWVAVTSASAAAETVAQPATALRHEDSAVIVPEASALRQSIVVVSTEEQQLRTPLVLPASVEADPSRQVKIAPPATGRISGLTKGLGDEVRAGEPLLRIDSADMAQAAADARKARAALTLASAALERQRVLRSDDIAAARDVEQAQSDHEQAATDLAHAQARLEQLSGTGAAARDTGGTTPDPRSVSIRSPISGRVIDIAAANGAFWNDATASLMTVADLSIVYVAASIDEHDLGAVRVGQDVQVRLDAYPDAPLTGKVRYVGETLDTDTRRVKLRVRFDNRDGRLKPGMFAQAVVLGRPHRSVVVPTTALVQSGFDTRVFVEVSPWRFEPRVVRLGPTNGGQAEVVAGLAAGDRVVVKDAVMLDE